MLDKKIKAILLIQEWEKIQFERYYRGQIIYGS